MLVAASAGRRALGDRQLAVRSPLLIAATIALIGAPSHRGPDLLRPALRRSVRRFGKALIFPAAAVAIIAAQGWFERDTEHGGEYAVLILFSAVGMGVMVSATSLISLYVGLELQSLSAYVLASYRRTDERSAEAGLKYFVLGALASGILLYGISLLYGFTGTTQFNGIAAAFGREAPSLGLLFGLVFMLAGLAFKASVVPFHMWTPDVYEGAPTPVTAFFASAPKVAAVLLATRVCLDALGPAIDAWRQIVIVAALASIFLGAVAAYGQTNIKRLLAYSSINNVGFALIGLAAGGAAGASSVLFYMAVYVVMTLGAFLCVLWMRDGDGPPGRGHRQPVGPVADPPGIRCRDRDLHVQPGRDSAVVRLLAQAAGVQRRGRQRLCRARGGRHRRHRGRRLLLSQDRQDHVFRRSRRRPRQGAPAGRGRADPARRAAVSPLGYLLIGPLGRLTDARRRILVLSRIRIVDANRLDQRPI